MASLALEILNVKLDIFENSFFKKLCCVFNLVIEGLEVGIHSKKTY